MTWPEQPLTAEYSFRGRWHRVGVLASDPKYILVLIRCCLAPCRNFPPGSQHANKPVNKAAHMKIFSVSRECWTRQMHRWYSAIICCSFHFLKLVFPQLPKLCFTGQIAIFLLKLVTLPLSVLFYVMKLSKNICTALWSTFTCSLKIPGSI